MFWGDMMKKKLDMRTHKSILSITLLVTIIISILFADRVISISGDESLIILIFGLLFSSFLIVLLMFSVLLRTRDELHEMHEENQRQFHELQERVKGKSVSKMRNKK